MNTIEAISGYAKMCIYQHKAAHSQIIRSICELIEKDAKVKECINSVDPAFIPKLISSPNELDFSHVSTMVDNVIERMKNEGTDHS